MDSSQTRGAAAPRTRAAAAAAALLLVLPAIAGCVERRVVIRSDPPGAQVLMDEQPLEGRTPVETPFMWDGVRRVTLVAPGHRVVDGAIDVQARWHDYFPLDVFAELLWPGTIEDVQVFEFQLDPYHPADQPFTDEQKADLRARADELKLRADEYRAGGSQGPGGAVVLPTSGDSVLPPSR